LDIGIGKNAFKTRKCKICLQFRFAQSRKNILEIAH
jgi:hypothetical protein